MLFSFFGEISFLRIEKAKAVPGAGAVLS